MAHRERDSEDRKVQMMSDNGVHRTIWELQSAGWWMIREPWASWSDTYKQEEKTWKVLRVTRQLNDKGLSRILRTPLNDS